MKPEIIISFNEERLDRIHFEAVPEGSSREVIFQLENIGELDVTDLDFEPDHEDIVVVSAPTIIDAHAKGELVLRYTPVIETEHGISATMKIRGKYVV